VRREIGGGWFKASGHANLKELALSGARRRCGLAPRSYAYAAGRLMSDETTQSLVAVRMR
jgi:hypothetical protein